MATMNIIQAMNRLRSDIQTWVANNLRVKVNTELKTDSTEEYKVLSDNNFTDADKSKLDGIAEGAEVNVQSDWNATSGDAFIKNKPTIPSLEGYATETWVNNQGFKTTDNDTHYITGITVGESGTTNNTAVTNPYVKIKDDNTHRSQIQVKGSGTVSVSSDASGVITIHSDGVEIPEVDLSDYALKSELQSHINTSSTTYATKAEIPTTLPANGGDADTVGGFTVGINVPSNAVFTDNSTTESGHYTPTTEDVNKKQSADVNGYISGIKLDSKKHVVGIETGTLPASVTDTTVGGWGYMKKTAADSEYAKKSEIPTVNNATLTIQKNGTNVGTFTANQSTATNINIEVPTKVTDLSDGNSYATQAWVSGEITKVATGGEVSVPVEDVKVNGVSVVTDKIAQITVPSEVTETTVSEWGFTKNTGTYSKPSGGIPKTDLASSIQTSLGKADTALQSYTEQYTGTITGVTAGNGLTGGATSGNATLNVGAGAGISVGNDTVAVDIKDTTKNSKAAVKGGNSDKLYAVELDSNGDLAVSVPWTATTFEGNDELEALLEPFALKTDLDAYKTKQDVVSDPSAKSETSTTFISSISQDANGVITAVKKTLPAYSTTDANCTEAGHYTPTTEDVTKKQSAGTGAYISSIKLDSKKHVVGIETETLVEQYQGTVTSVSLKAGDGISLDDESAITSNGERTISHAVTSEVEADTQVGELSDKTKTSNSLSFSVPNIKVDKFGHVTELGESTINVSDLRKYVTCSTPADTAEKEISISDLDELTTGMTILVYFNYENTAMYPTLNVNNTGAKYIRYQNIIVSGQDYRMWRANTCVEFWYNGTYWDIITPPVYYGKLVATNSYNNPTNAVAANGSVNLNYVIDDRIVTSDTKIIGDKGISVTSNSSGKITISNSTYSYGVCDTASDVADKVVTIDGDFSLVAGSQVVVKFNYMNTAIGPTLNVNSTGAKSIIPSSYTGASQWPSSATLTFVYDGSSWDIKDSSCALTTGVHDSNAYCLQVINSTTSGLAISNRGSIVDTVDGDLYIHHGGTNSNAIYCDGGNIVADGGNIVADGGHFDGAYAHNTRIVTGACTLNKNDSLVLYNTTDDYYMTLPSNPIDGQMITVIKKSGTGTLTFRALNSILNAPQDNVFNSSTISVTAVGVRHLYYINSGWYVFLMSGN